MNSKMLAPCLAGLSLGFVACAGTQEIPVEALATAEANISRAEDAGAREEAALALDNARNKLQTARLAVEEEDYMRATHLAEQAAIDAELAAALADESQARAAARELQESIAALRAETRRE